MNRKEKIIVIAGALAVLGTFSTAGYVMAGTRDNDKAVDVVNITWHVPDEFKEADTVVEYTAEVDEPEYQFNPEAYIRTNDDNLINYAAKGWTNVSDNYVDYEAPNIEYNSKTYMRFQKFGYNEGNRQSALSRGSYAYTGDYDCRMVDGRYLIALGTYYTDTIGQYVDILLEDGTVIPCMLGDVKADTHTDENHQYQKWDKSVMEFIVDSPNTTGGKEHDYDYFRETTGINNSFTEVPEFESRVVGIRVYDKVFDYVLGDTSNDNPDVY